ncbi:NADPH-dependent ferric siderophore reductase [Arcanobacterium pluranimalium]|uniref:siderophore-interacting protein n=1 Tax=Arcanobacterium pluranimalium TaxID=108028 RepID=UPI00195DE922|nr:siderophore-interacting protein [Arcanobacterium pluranimalium]MBM7825385.1 NADPH-dependent ferric siderophore reductase [Arcanobacterium pluranimalium]
MVEIFGKTKKKHGLKARYGVVTHIEHIDDAFVRVRIEGDELADLPVQGPSDHFKLVLPHKDREQIEYDPHTCKLGSQEISRDLTAMKVLPTGIEIDIAKHADGELAQWLTRFSSDSDNKDFAHSAHVLLLGPKSSIVLPPVEQILIAVDHSAFPALTRWLDHLDDNAHIDVVLITTWDGVQRYFHKHWTRSNVTFHIIEPDYSGETLLDLIKSLPLEADQYVWLAGEASTLIPARKWLRNESGIPKENMKIDGYWKHGVAGRSHHDPIDPNEPELG